MADIDLERKEHGGMGWLWGALALLALVAVVWWIWPDGEDAIATEPGDGVEAVEPMADEPVADQPMAGEPGQVMIGDILDNPESYIGQSFPTMGVEVAEVPTDRGFWIEAEGERLFAIIIDQPQEDPVDINPGASLNIEGGTLRDASYLPDLPGEPLDAQTEQIARDQEVFLVVDEENVTITEQARM